MKSLGSILAVLMLLVGAAAIGYAQWSRGITEGDASLAAGQLEQALVSYRTAEGRFDRIPATKQLFAADYNHVITNQLWLMYRLGRFDETIDKAERSPDTASPHFWSGLAFFEKARAEEKPDARLGWLSRAEEELHRAVQATPTDWDTKFDFELTTRIVTELRKQPKTPAKQMMQLLRPPTSTSKPVRRVG